MRRITGTIKTSIMASVSCLVFMGTPAFAQDDTVTARQETIIVTGTRQAYRGDFQPLETPQAELAIDTKTLTNAGALDLTQALDLSASVARQNNFGGLWNAFAVRGFVGDENLPSNYLVNGFNAGRGFGGPRDLSGIESVEVLKGPRAALYGRGEPGGTINLITKRPTFETAGEAKLTAGSHDFYRVDGDWTSPVSNNAAIRLVGFYEDAKSFRNTIKTTKYGFSPSIAINLSPSSKLSYELETAHQEIPFDRGVPAINGVLGRVPIGNFLGEPGDGPMKADVLGHQIEYQYDFDENWSSLIGFGYRDTSLEGFSTEASFGSRQYLSVDQKNLSRNRRFRDYDAVHTVLRGEITGTFSAGGFSHRVIFGADYDTFEIEQTFLRARPPRVTSVPAPSAEALRLINVFNPVYGKFPLTDLGKGKPFTQTFRATGLFVQDQISLTDRLDIRIGARFDDFEEKETGQADDRISPQFGIVYRAADHVSVYAAYGESFRQQSGGNDPNISQSIEAGVKATLFDGKLDATAVIFDVEQSNILGVVDLNSFLPEAIGAAQSRGFEFDLMGTIMQDVNLWLSYSYVDAKTARAFKDVNFGVDNPAGSSLLNIPKHQLTLQLAKTTQFAGRALEFGGGLRYVGKRNGQFSDQTFNLPDYTMARAFLAYDIIDNVTLRAEIDNLFDEVYYTNSFASVWVQPGAPRNLRISAAFRF